MDGSNIIQLIFDFVVISVSELWMIGECNFVFVGLGFDLMVYCLFFFVYGIVKKFVGCFDKDQEGLVEFRVDFGVQINSFEVVEKSGEFCSGFIEVYVQLFIS